MDISCVQGLTTAKNNAPVSYGSNQVVNASVRSRDPRLRFASSSTLDLNNQPVPMVHNAPKLEPVGRGMSSRKQRTVKEPVLDRPALKRHRNGYENSLDSGVVRDEKYILGSCGWLDTKMVEPQIMNRNQPVDSAESYPRKLVDGATCPITTSGTPSEMVCGNEPVPVTIPCTSPLLPALLKDIAVNPNILLNILMGQQQKLAADIPQKSYETTLINTMHLPISNSIPPVNFTSLTTSAILPKPIKALQDELGKVRMKPRDPRRVLHGNALQRRGSLEPEHKTDGPSTPSTQGSKEILNFQMPQGPAEAKPLLSQSVLQQDFTHQFTKNLKDVADFVSAFASGLLLLLLFLFLLQLLLLLQCFCFCFSASASASASDLLCLCFCSAFCFWPSASASVE